MSTAASPPIPGDSSVQATLWGWTTIIYSFIPSNGWQGPGGPSGPSGNWSGTLNWGGGTAPNAACAVAYLGPTSSAGTITIDSPITLGTLIFDSDYTYTLNGSSTVTFQCDEGTLLSTQRGSHVISAPVVVASDMIADMKTSSSLSIQGNFTIAAGKTVTKNGFGTLTISGAQTPGSGAAMRVTTGVLNLNSDAGSNLALSANTGSATVNFGSTQRLASTSLSNGAIATIAGGATRCW
jgi:hypothetical protein